MTKPSKIRVLYFDESPTTLERFINLCGCKELMEIVGVFRSFPEIAPLMEEDEYRFLRSLSLDVVVLRIDGTGADWGESLQKMKRCCNVKLVGLLSGPCLTDRALLRTLDYHTEAAGATSIVTDADVYTHLFYQIKSARLVKKTQEDGVKGRWALLPPPPKAVARRKFGLIAIGASAGGTEAVSTILSALPTGLPPILLVQHMPDNFTDFFAANLAARVAMQVVVARDGERLEDGVAYVAGNGKHLEVVREQGGYYARCKPGDKVSGHRPSVDALFLSAAKAARSSAIGVILTGMGSDGARGLLEMHDAGAYTIGQDEKTSTVYGMPMVAYTLGAVSKQLPLGSIAQAILSALASKGGEEKDHV